MATTNGSDVGGLLAQSGARIKLSALLVGAAWWVVTCLGVWFFLLVLDNLLSLPAGLRLPLAVAGAALAGVGFFKRVLRIAAQRMAPERTAVLLEHKYKIEDNVLINTYQFNGRELNPAEKPFVAQTAARCGSLLHRIKLEDLWDREDLIRWGIGAGVVLGLWIGYVAIFPKHAFNAAGRFVVPLADRPPVASVDLTVRPGTDVTVVEGDNLEVAVEVKSEKREMGIPLLVWKERVGSVEPVKSAGENVPLFAAPGGGKGKYTYTFPEVRRSFAFRVFADDAYSRSVLVKVKPLPRIKESFFRLTLPEYIGLGAITNPGPPASISGLAGSKLETVLVFDTAIEGGYMREAHRTNRFMPNGPRWSVATTITNSGEYEVIMTGAGLAKSVSLARAAIRMDADQAPEVDFVTDDRNRVVTMMSKLKLEVQARDDYGLANVTIALRAADQQTDLKVLKKWTYLGPPGNKGPVKEAFVLEIDPKTFQPDINYVIEGLAWDFRPNAAPAKARPILLRVKSLSEFKLADADPLGGAIASLRQTIAAQKKATDLTANVKTYLEEVLQKKTLEARQKSMAGLQADAYFSGQTTIGEFKKSGEGTNYVARLKPLVDGEMKLVLEDVPKITGKEPAAIAGRLAAIEKRQTFILEELMQILGKIAAGKESQGKTNELAKDTELPPDISKEDAAKGLRDDMKKFIAEQERLLKKSKTLMDQGPEDLSKEEKDALVGELAREEGKLAKFLEDKINDFSKLPQQDFADGAVVKEANEVFQEVKKAEEALYNKNVEMAVPAEQGGLENAKKLVQNLEKWLPNAKDSIKWKMEEANAPADIAMAELPAELEDIVGDLLDKEEEMMDDVEDVTSPWMDSMDKGAGWDAADGNISSMSAKGVTGNQLPNKQEIGGRSGEGREGRSSGQMVEETAEGKGGREAPTRVSPSPFEPGQVKDSNKEAKGGATGGGKQSGFAGEGLRGNPPPPSDSSKLPRLAEAQAKLRQEAEMIALKLRKFNVPTGDLEASINAMKRMETAMAKKNGLEVRRSFSQAINGLSAAKKTLRAEATVNREKASKLPGWQRDEIRTGLKEGVPKGYEQMIGEYFRTLAEKNK